ncbi:MAG: dual specificity protein phosphatase family protein [Rubrivivax sp.]
MTANFQPHDLRAAGDALPRPHADSYWVVPGRLLAGAHPSPHLPALLAAGIGSFVDLTQAQHPPATYTQWLGEKAKWQGFAIVDFGVPEAALMRRILDTIDASLAEGSVVYVHCHAGVGRTGTAVGCWLVEQGLAADEALALIDAKRRVLARYSWAPRSPETDAQHAFVRAWQTRGGPPVT